MNTRLRLLIGFGLAVLSLGLLCAPLTVVAADIPPDQLESYTISVTPQADGSLVMSYALYNYCAKSDWPSDIPYLQVGVPNGNFIISEFGPKDGVIKVVNAEKIVSGGTFVQLDFDASNLPKDGDCFNLNFSIVQGRMAYSSPESGDITFELIPAGWDFPIQVKTLTLNWATAPDIALIKLTDPAPAATDSVNMVWQWNNPQSDASGMFRGATIKLVYGNEAFTLPADTPTAQSNNGGTVEPINAGLFLVVVLAVVVFVIVAAAVVFLLNTGGDGLGSDNTDEGFGDRDTTVYIPKSPRKESRSTKRDQENEAPRRRESTSPSYSPPSRPSYSPPSRPSHSPPSRSSGGGFGGSSGHSSGCASMPSCACACACAGGSRVGCSRKAIGIKCFDDVISKMNKASQDDKITLEV